MAAKTTADKLSSLKGLAKPKEPAKSSKKEMRVIDFTNTPVEEAISKLCELGYMNAQLKPVTEQHHAAVQGILFDKWTEEFFATKKVPENFKAGLKKKDKKDKTKATTFDDMACSFILKFRADGISKKIPSKGELDEQGKTVQEVLTETLISGVVGITAEQASKFIEAEIEISEVTAFSGGLESFLGAEEGTDQRIVGNYLVACLTADSKKELSKLDPLTDAQRALSLMVIQTVTLKDGVEQRILDYVDSLDQLRKLLNFLSVTKQVSNFDFGISDEVDERNSRLTDVAYRHLNLVEGE